MSKNGSARAIRGLLGVGLHAELPLKAPQDRLAPLMPWNFFTLAGLVARVISMRSLKRAKKAVETLREIIIQKSKRMDMSKGNRSGSMTGRVIPHCSAVLTFLAAFFLATSAAHAHRVNETYIYFNVTETSLSGRFEAMSTDLEELLSLDRDGDGIVSDQELQAEKEAIFQYFADRLSVSIDGNANPISQEQLTSFKSAVGTFVQIWFSVPGISLVPDTIEVDYRPLSDALGRSHTGYVLIESNKRTGLSENESEISLIFNASGAPQTLFLAGGPWYQIIPDFIVHGVWHIWIGFDHVLFLILLLLPSVMIVTNNRWLPLSSFRPAIWNVVKIVTVFTVSHSVTLTLAALGVVQLPVSMVESIIALSIIAVAVMHFFPDTHRYMLATVFIFGLFHGFGFANVLAPLGLDLTNRLIGVAAFNIGVELGQLAIVFAVFPLLWLAREWRFYPPIAFKYTSIVVILLAGLWFIERTFDIEWETALANVTTEHRPS